MATQTVIESKTAAGEGLLPTDQFDSVVIHADNLAGAEEVDVHVMGGATPTVYAPGGTAVKLTATAPVATLPPGPTYKLSKDATAGSCAVFASYAPIS